MCVPAYDEDSEGPDQALADQSLHCLLTKSLDTTECMNEDFLSSILSVKHMPSRKWIGPKS